MPLVLAPMTEQDIPAFADVDAAAMAGWPYAEAMMAPGTDRRKAVEGWTRVGWGKDPTAHWLKVTDTDTGELIAAALWRLLFDDPPAEAGAGGDDGETMQKGDREERKSGIDKKREEDPDTSQMFRESQRLGRLFDDEFVHGAPRAILSMIVTHPKHQRRGAGGMLVRWGCEKADEAGVICLLTASEAGLVGYLKHGFEIKKISPIDLRPYGYDHTELRRYMIRPAKATS